MKITIESDNGSKIWKEWPEDESKKIKLELEIDSTKEVQQGRVSITNQQEWSS